LIAFILISSASAGYAATAQPGICTEILSAQRSSLDRISGHVEIYQNDQGYNAVFKSGSGETNKIDGGAGEQLIEVLKSHADENSPTALRVEEKAIINPSDIQRFLKETQTSSALAAYNGNQALKWEQRDQPAVGQQFVTITEYGGQIIYHLNGSLVSFVAKARYRKYYEFPVGQQQHLTAYKPVLGDLTALEIKMTSIAGPSTNEFLAEPETVFKPRIMITNEIADALKTVRGDDLNMLEKLSAIKDQVLALNKPNARPLNRIDQVESLFNALVLLLKADPSFLEPSLTISYERESYRLNSSKGEFQYTVDRNVKMYAAAPSLPTARMKEYLFQTKTFQSRPTEAFAEMKTPIKLKQTHDPLYVGLYDSLNLNHLPNYPRGSGKKSVAKYLEQAIGDQNIDRTILDQGVEFWMIKSVSSLDTYPKKNDLVSKQKMIMAVPFIAKTGEEFKLLLTYQPVKKTNSSHIAVLSKVELIDPNGAKLKVEPGFDDFVKAVTIRKDIALVGLDIDNTVVPFPVRLSEEEVDAYDQFLGTFFRNDTNIVGQVRDLNRFSQIKTAASLKLQMTKLKMDNALKWIVDRSGKFAMGGLLTIGILTARDYFMFNPVQNPSVPSTVIEKVEAANAVPVIQVNGFKDKEGQVVPLKGYMDPQHNYYFYFSDEMSKKYGAQKTIQLYVANGESVHLNAIGIKGGKLIYSLSK
ncbi:MAG: hypothetical protein AABZ31_07930, partial [Bdellovibrionota bacterium]